MTEDDFKMKFFLFFITLYILKVSLGYSKDVCSDQKNLDVMRDLSSQLSPSQDEKIDCKTLNSSFMEFAKTLSLRVTEIQTSTNHGYYMGIKHYQKNGQNLQVAMKYFTDVYPEIFKNCNFIPGEPLKELPFLGEPQNICLSAAMHYELYVKDLGHDVSLEYARNEIRYALAQLPGGRSSQIMSFINDHCSNKSALTKEIDLYDIPIFKNNLESFKYFEHKDNKSIKKNLNKGLISKFETIKVPCSKALEKINEQSKHWHSMLSAMDTTIALASGENLRGKKYYQQFTYGYVDGNATNTLEIFDTILRLGSLILSSNGYLNQNIKTYETQCLIDSDASSFYNLIKKESFDFVIDQRANEVKTLNSSMDSIVAKKFNNFSAPALPQVPQAPAASSPGHASAQSK